jgi:type III restriction enzyme
MKLKFDRDQTYQLQAI